MPDLDEHNHISTEDREFNEAGLFDRDQFSLRVANIVPKVTLDPLNPKSGLHTLTLTVLGPDDFSIGDIKIKNINSNTTSELIEMLHSDFSTPEVLKIAQNSEPRNYEYLPEKALDKILNAATQAGGSLVSKFGRGIKGILSGYAYKKNLNVENEAKSRKFTIDRSNACETSNPDNCSAEEVISWIDLETPLCNRLDTPEKIENYVYNEHKDLLGDKHEDYSILDLRIMTEGSTDCKVERQKLFILIGKDNLITIHDQALDCLDHLEQQIKQVKPKNQQAFGTGYFLARLMEKVVEQNELTLRQLEDTTEFILREIEVAKPDELPSILGDLLDMQRTVRYTQRKMSDEEQNFKIFETNLSAKKIKIASESLKPEQFKEKLARLGSLFQDLHERAEKLAERTKDIREYHNAQIGMHTDIINTRLALLGAVFGPIITALTFIEIIPALKTEPKLLAILGGGMLISATLFCLGKLKKLF